MSAPKAAWTGRLRVVGDGRAGGSIALALGQRGWAVADPVHRGDDPSGAAHDVDLVVIATPDSVIADVGAAVRPNDAALVVHLAGSLGVDVLATHPRRGALHPLVSLPDPSIGSQRLAAGAWFAVAASALDDQQRLVSIVGALGGQHFHVNDAERAAYHGAAVIASNHLVALAGQVERIATGIGVPLEAFLALSSQTLEGVRSLGPSGALTGPVQRGDWNTVAWHLGALPAEERPAYVALADAAARLVDDAGEPPAWFSALVAHGDGSWPVDPMSGDDEATR